MISVEIVKDLILIRERNDKQFKSRVFIKHSGITKPMHLSAFRGKNILEIVFSRGSIEYVLRKNSFSDSMELYDVSLASGELYTLIYRVQKDRVESLGKMLIPPEASSGFSAVDKIVEEISLYRDIWSRILCADYNLNSTFYKVFLLADLGLNYSLFLRLKEAWLEFSNEYIGFILSLIHDILLKAGYKVANNEVINEKCSAVVNASSITWKGTNVNYVDNANHRVEIYIERMISGLTPDLLITNGNKRVVFECKQGPPKTWFNKAIKQAEKYRKIAQSILLITCRSLDPPYRSELLRYYDYVIDKCSWKNQEHCAGFLAQVMGLKLNI